MPAPAPQPAGMPGMHVQQQPAPPQGPVQPPHQDQASSSKVIVGIAVAACLVLLVVSACVVGFMLLGDDGATDTDGDGVPDSSDAFPADPKEWSDIDGDGIGDWADSTQLHFEWQYKASTDTVKRTWTWNPTITHGYYSAYKGYSVDQRYEYGKLVTTRDPVIQQIVSSFNSTIASEGYGAFDGPSWVLAFVQSIDYAYDNVSTGYDDYSKFPIETLFGEEGDCEDTSILYTTLMRGLGYDATLFLVPADSPVHMASGIAGGDGVGQYYVQSGSKKYYYCESTGEGFKIGDMPSEYVGKNVKIVSISGNQYVPEYGKL